MHVVALLMCTHPSFILPTFEFCFIGIRVGFTVCVLVVVSHLFFGSIVDAKGGGDINMRLLCERYQLRLKVLSSVRWLITNQVCNVLKPSLFSLANAYTSP